MNATLYTDMVLYWIRIHLIGSLSRTPSSNQYIMTVIDYFSKWAEAFPLADKTATQCCMVHVCDHLLVKLEHVDLV